MKLKTMLHHRGTEENLYRAGRVPISEAHCTGCFITYGAIPIAPYTCCKSMIEPQRRREHRGKTMSGMEFLLYAENFLGMKLVMFPKLCVSVVKNKS